MAKLPQHHNNALLGDLSSFGRSIDDDVRRLIQHYGMEATKAAMKRAVAPKRGRPKIPDWSELRADIEQDAKIWLEGGDPFALRSDYAIAKAHADSATGNSATATMQRLERKLRSKPYSRKWFVYVTAMQFSTDAYSYKRHIEAIRALLRIHPEGPWSLTLQLAERNLSEYTRNNGPPPDGMTMQEVELGSRTLNVLARLPSRLNGGLLNLLGSITPQGFEGPESDEN